MLRYIIPMPPPGMPPPAGAPPSFSGLSATRHSVVITKAAMDAAFCNAARVTLAGSMMPAIERWLAEHLPDGRKESVSTILERGEKDGGLAELESIDKLVGAPGFDPLTVHGEDFIFG